MRVKKLYTFRKSCAYCGEEFEFDGYSYSGRMYCSKECRDNGMYIKTLRRIASKPEKKYHPGAFGLEADPWATGQLPDSVRANALWRSA